MNRREIKLKMMLDISYNGYKIDCKKTSQSNQFTIACDETRERICTIQNEEPVHMHM